MSESNPEADTTGADLDPEDYGSLTVEDEGAETVFPADVAGTAEDDEATSTVPTDATTGEAD